MRVPHVQNQDREKQPERSPTPYTTDIPPAGHPIHDILRMTGQLPEEPNKPNATLTRLVAEGKIKPDEPSQSQVPSPLNNLFAKIYQFFADGPQTASVRFAAIQTSVTSGEAEVTPSAYQSAVATRTLAGTSLPWNSCKLAATLVLLHAVSKDAEVMLEALTFLSRGLGGLPTMSVISGTPSAKLAPRFVRAKKAAVDGKVGKCTVLGISLVDVEMIERGERGDKPMGYTSFAHAFVLALGRQGWRIFQSWGEHGYTLDEYLERGGATLRDWKEAKAFLKAFLVLTTAEVRPQPLIHHLADILAELSASRDPGRSRSTTHTKHASR